MFNSFLFQENHLQIQAARAIMFLKNGKTKPRCLNLPKVHTLNYELNLDGCRQRIYRLLNNHQANGSEALTIEYETAKTYCSPEYHCSFFPATHTCFMLFRRGSGTLIYDDKTYFPKAGDFFLLHAGHYWEFYTDKEDLWEIFWLNANTESAKTIISEFYLDDVVSIPAKNWNEILEKIYQTIAHSDESIYEKREKVFRAVFSLLSDIYRLTCMPKGKSKQEDDAIILKNYIDGHIEESLSIPALSKMVNRTVGNATKIFKETVGLPLKKYILQTKFKLAEKYLLQGKLSVNQISDSLSFCSTQHFSQSFRKIYGCSPLQFQRKWKKEKG